MIGISCTQFGTDDPEEVMGVVSKEFGLWEIFSESRNAVTEFSSRFNDIKASYNMRYSIHAPICDINIAAINDRIREASVKEMIDTMEHARRMDIQMVTIHPGLYSMVLSDVGGASEEMAKRSLKKIDKESIDRGITVAVENMPSFRVMMGQTPQGLLDLIEGTDLNICFDIGHANTIGMIDEFIDEFSGRIVNIHIHDNEGKEDSHMTIGQGNIDFFNVLSRLRSYKGNYIIEARNLDSAIESKRYLKEMMKNI